MAPVVVWSVLAGLLILIGLVGMVLPILPGPVFVVAGVAVWAIPRNDAIGWWVLGIATVLILIGQVVKFLIPGKQLRDAGVPNRTLLLGAVLGIVGFFVIPVVGLFLGFVLGIYLAELARLKDSAKAWPATKHSLKAVGWSMLIELASGLLATGAWIAGLILG